MENNFNETEHQENLEKEFAMKQQQNNAPLGSIDMGTLTGADEHRLTAEQTAEIQRNFGGGFMSIKMTSLPSKGMFYQDKTEITVRGCTVKEVRDFSTIDESDVVSINDHIKYILSNCIRVRIGNYMGSYKDLMECDKWYVLLFIRDLTFPHHENRIMMPVISRTCASKDCGGQTEVELTHDILQFEEFDEKIIKYYDNIGKVLNVETKSFGVLPFYMPTVGVVEAVQNYTNDENESIDLSTAQMLPFLFDDWRKLNNDVLKQKCVEIAGYGAKLFALKYRMAEEINKVVGGMKSEITVPCTAGDGEVTCQFSFQNGIRELFIPSLSSLADELV